MKKKGYIVIGCLLAICITGAVVWYGYLYKDARNISTETAAYTVSAEALTGEYRAAQQKADAKYLNKTVAITGVVTAVKDSVVTLNDKVFCSFGKKADQPEGKQITVKGRCIGYDELFEEVKLDQCTLND